ncbi:MAG: maltotransferase domain-containing protein, partial [bacterium]
MLNNGRNRVIIENVKPEIDAGRFPIKRVVGEKVTVLADIFADGHDAIFARLLYKKQTDGAWKKAPMQFFDNDRWQGNFTVTELGIYFYTIEGWVDHFLTWRQDIKKKFDAGQDIKVDLLIGVELIEAAAKRAEGKDANSFSEFAETIKNEKDFAEAVDVALSRR